MKADPKSVARRHYGCRQSVQSGAKLARQVEGSEASSMEMSGFPDDSEVDCRQTRKEGPRSSCCHFVLSIKPKEDVLPKVGRLS